MKVILDKSDIDLLTLAIDLSLNGIGRVIKDNSAPNEYDNLTYLSTKLIILKSHIQKQR